MFFQTNYDTLNFSIYESKMLIDENGDTVTTRVDDSESFNFPNDFYLYPSYPNPFNSTTTIKYSLAKEAFIEIKLYDILGKLIKYIYKGEQKGGTYSHQIKLDDLSSGTYIISLLTNHSSHQQKISLIK